MPRLTVEVYQSLMDALLAHCEKTGEPLRHFVSRALSDALGLDHSTLFQVSTTGALVQGVYNKAVTVGGLRPHGDFGLGTFEGLDGEMVVLDGKFYQAHADGSITSPGDNVSVPFATLTNFKPQHRGQIIGIDSMSSLIAALDKLRRSDNLFFAARLDGHFEEVYWRVACKVEAGVHLDKATDAQAEFRQQNVKGTDAGLLDAGLLPHDRRGGMAPAFPHRGPQERRPRAGGEGGVRSTCRSTTSTISTSPSRRRASSCMPT